MSKWYMLRWPSQKELPVLMFSQYVLVIFQWSNVLKLSWIICTAFVQFTPPSMSKPVRSLLWAPLKLKRSAWLVPAQREATLVSESCIIIPAIYNLKFTIEQPIFTFLFTVSYFLWECFSHVPAELCDGNSEHAFQIIQNYVTCVSEWSDTKTMTLFVSCWKLQAHFFCRLKSCVYCS